jgi:surface antigen
MHVATGVAESERTRVVSAFTNGEGQPCNVVEQTVNIGGERVRATGTVCRQSGGTWALMR